MIVLPKGSHYILPQECSLNVISAPSPSADRLWSYLRSTASNSYWYKLRYDEILATIRHSQVPIDLCVFLLDIITNNFGYNELFCWHFTSCPVLLANSFLMILNQGNTSEHGSIHNRKLTWKEVLSFWSLAQLKKLVELLSVHKNLFPLAKADIPIHTALLASIMSAVKWATINEIIHMVSYSYQITKKSKE